MNTAGDELRIMTLQAHILEQQADHPEARGTFSWILSALSISAKIIADKVRRARLENVLGSVGMFVLDPSIGAFMRVERSLRIPPDNKTYSVNEGNRTTFPAGYRRYLDWAQNNGYSSRYAGAMVADVHRILLKGGVFLYPPTQKSPDGKLRLMYEANPMAMIVEQAGGKAVAGADRRILDIQPSAIHQRTPVILGAADQVDAVLAHLARD
jgi:fructose-1,6-bisphosphatase I